MKTYLKKIILATSLIMLLLGLSGCAGLVGGQKMRKTSSVVEFLYPNNTDVSVKPTVTHLRLPINVGVVFVPETAQRYVRHRLSATDKQVIADKIAANFKQYKFVKNVEVIPTDYLRPGGGFDNLDQLKTMYGIDVIALLSYDQIQYTDEGLLSLMYWTIVGAYIFNGEKNDTSTMIDAAIFDIRSRKMLFRAPGTSQVKGTATPVNLSEELRKDSIKGFHLATDKLLENLANELARFKTRIKERPDEIKVKYSSGYSGGYSGGGYLDGVVAIMLVSLLGLAAFYERKHRPG